MTEHFEDVATQESMEDLPTQQVEESLETSPTVPPPEEGGAEPHRPSTPPLMNNLMEMGFTRPQINVAMERYMCVFMNTDMHTCTYTIDSMYSKWKG